MIERVKYKQICLVMFAISSALIPEADAKDQSQPNIIWIMAEDISVELECDPPPIVKPLIKL